MSSRAATAIETVTATGPHAPGGTVSLSVRALAAAVAAGAAVFLGLHNLGVYPTTWFDEGLVLQGPINLVNHGKYAMRSSEGFRVLDQPLIANGPGLVLPIGASFSLFGVGLLQARLVVVVYLLVALFLSYRLSALLSGQLAAAISVLALLAMPDGGILMYGRQALGNVPALAYFLAGTCCFAALAQRQQTRYAVLAGVFWALALVTKGQYWVLLPVLAAVSIADWLWYKRIGIRKSAVLGGVLVLGLVAWQVLQLALVGPGNHDQHLSAIASSARVSVFALNARRIGYSLFYLATSGYLILVLPGLCVAAGAIGRHSPLGIVRFFLVLFVCSWTVWFTVASIGWARYAFEAFAVGVLLIGGAVTRLPENLETSRFSTRNRPGLIWNVGAWSLAVAILFLISSGLSSNTAPIFNPPADAVTPFARQLQRLIPDGAVVESWEWELDVFTSGTTYHHPTNDWVDLKTAELHSIGVPTRTYDPAIFAPDYLIDGPFSKRTNAYTEFLAANCCTPIASVGDYTLYAVRNNRQEWHTLEIGLDTTR